MNKTVLMLKKNNIKYSLGVVLIQENILLIHMQSLGKLWLPL